MTASSTIITRPPLNSATRNCQPRRISNTRPSSKTRLVEANSKITALANVAPLRNSVRATATAAYEHEDDAAPSAVASATDFGVSRPSSRETACLETSASTTDDNRNPSASGQSTCQDIANDSRSAQPS